MKAQVNLDSLYSVWQDQTQSDSLRAKAYSDYIWDGFLFSQPDTAFILAKELVLFGRENNYPRALAAAYSVQGVSWVNRGDYPKTLDFYTRALEIYEQIGDKSGIAGALNNIGTVYDIQGNYPKALDYYVQCLEISGQNGTVDALNNIGQIYMGQGDFQKALDYTKQSLEILKQIGDQNATALAISNIGRIYMKQDNYPEALNYYTQSLEIYNQIGNQIGIANSFKEIGLIYHKKGDYLKALDYYMQSLEINKESGEQSGIASSLTDIGVIYQNQGDYTKALNYCQTGYELSLSIGSLKKQMAGCSCLYDTYKSMGDGNQALKYHELLTSIEDSLHIEETSKKLQQMEFAKQVLKDSIAQIETDRLVLEAHQEEVRKKDRTRNISFGIGGLVLLLAGGLYSRLRYVRKSKATLQVEKDRSDNLLLNILPEEIAQELKEKGKADARDFDLVSILFTDFKGFTEQSAKLSAQDLVSEINTCFEAFDGIMEKYKIEKIKTIGDAYMAAGGLPVPTDDSVKNTVLAALEMQVFIDDRKKTQDARGLPAFEMRVGIHTGPVVAGIVGVKKFQYDIWGDTVNTASRMESAGQVDKVNISQATYELIKDESQFAFESRGKIEAKGKGEMEMYFATKK